MDFGSDIIHYMARLVAIALLILAAPALGSCAGEGGGSDAATEPVCIPGRLRCDPAGTQVLERCSEDGSGWEAFQACVLCNDSMCYGTLDGSSG